MKQMSGVVTRRDLLRNLGLAAGTGFLTARCGRRDAGSPGERPNIVMIMSDDMGYSDLGCYGGEIRTPHLDRLGFGGMRFTRFYTNNVCSPSRAALMTGIQSDLSLELGEGPGLQQAHITHRAPTLAEALRGAGYGTYMSGKWHLASATDDFANLPCQRGFDRFYGGIIGAYSYFAPYSLMRDNQTCPEEYEDPAYYFTDAISDNAVDFLVEADDRDEPFFLYVAYNAAHWPLHARESDVAKYRGNYALGWDELRDQRHARMKKLGVIDPDWQLSPRNPDVPAWEDEPHKDWQQRRMEVYAAQVEVMDEGIGRILAELERQGKLDNTLVCFQHDNGGCRVEYTTDHPHEKFQFEGTRDGRPLRAGNDPEILPGPEDTFQSYGYGWANASNTPFRLYKSNDHEGGICVPLIAHWPGVIEPGAIDDQIAHVTDLMPTFLDVARAERPPAPGDEPPVPMDGRTLGPVLRGHRREPPAALFWEGSGSRSRAVRQGKWKLVAVGGQPWELYDVEADGTELSDLAPQMSAKVAELAALWDEWASRR